MPEPRTPDPACPRPAASPSRTGEPSSVWICPTSPEADWSPEILTEVTTALTTPDQHVLLVHTSSGNALRHARHVVNALGRSATLRQASSTTAAATRRKPHLALTNTRPDARSSALVATVVTVANLLPTGGVWAALTHSDTTGRDAARSHRRAHPRSRYGRADLPAAHHRRPRTDLCPSTAPQLDRRAPTAPTHPPRPAAVHPHMSPAHRAHTWPHHRKAAP